MKRTPLYERHVALGARMVEFGGWQMPIQYPAGIIAEHLATRRKAGLFDVSHMGRFVLRGPGALPFLQEYLTNNAAALGPGRAQYTLIPTPTGGALDDAYLYCTGRDDYLLVVNAANHDKDWEYFQEKRRGRAGLQMEDLGGQIAMISLQGPESRRILLALLAEGSLPGGVGPDRSLPEPGRNNLCGSAFDHVPVTIARTGYTGEALGFELFLPSATAPTVWDRLIALGAAPVGLGARDTLRLEAALPLYGHELGIDPEGREIPVFASALARFAVSFSALKGDFVGREALERQAAAFRSLRTGRPEADAARVLPRFVRAVSLLEEGIARQGAEILAPAGADGAPGGRLGWVTSGTVAPFWTFTGEGATSVPSDGTGKRAIALALVDSSIAVRQPVEVDIRGRRCRALVVPYLLRSEAPPYSRPIIWTAPTAPAPTPTPPGPVEVYRAKAVDLLARAVDNHRWRQRECLNLIPSEMTISPAARLLSISDPAFRYAEHRKVTALLDAEVFYYQGTGFIGEVERLLAAELASFLGCRQVETRLVSGQMANTAVFSALVDYLNRDDRHREPRRLRSVLNNHIIKGGHLSAQPMGALRDYVARDVSTERPAVTAFPVRADNPYQIDVSRVGEVLERCRPELVILGKSMIIHREPVAELRAAIDALGLPTVLMYDMAHVLGLAGPHFQEPFREGADIVTASTHKTFFGTQRGIAAADIVEQDPRLPLWRAIERRTFPGAVSNHHLGTLLALLLAAYEMNAFRDDYQRQVLANAKALARALREQGLAVAGDPALGFTETHQVVVEVGYGQGVEAAERLEDSNIIVNYQASPREEGFTAAGSLRLGVAEMSRFGMKEKDFGEAAVLIAEAIRGQRSVKAEVVRLRSRFLELGYCFAERDLEGKLAELHKLV
jgi:aminomethyltransferase